MKITHRSTQEIDSTSYLTFSEIPIGTVFQYQYKSQNVQPQYRSQNVKRNDVFIKMNNCVIDNAYNLSNKLSATFDLTTDYQFYFEVIEIEIVSLKEMVK